MTKHYYRYLVSYYYYWRAKQNFLSMTNKPYQPDFASVSLDCDTMIESDEDIRLLMEIIKNDLNKSKEVGGDIVILSFQLMKEYDKESED